jgi:hypothetical protein
MKYPLTIMSLIILTSLYLQAQDMVSTTLVSQRSSTVQRIGTTDVTIVYHSPLVQGRKIFGGVVPFDFVVDGKEYPWRAGSNKNTTIVFTHPVKIEGKPLPAGSYGFHVFVKEKEWTMIFSKNFESWGSFQYTKEEDALRVTVPAEKSSFQEWLSYTFIDREAESAAVELRWEETKASFKVEVDVNQNILNDLTEKEDKSAGDYLTFARQTAKMYPENVDAALELVDTSISMKKGFHNQMFKADLMIKSGDSKGASLKDDALASAEGFDMYYYGLSAYLLKGDKKESFQLLSDYLTQKPEDWIAHLALANIT